MPDETPTDRDSVTRVTDLSTVQPKRPDTLVEARGVGVNVASRWLIKDVDLTLRRGEIVTLIGPNGAGKSTLAEIATGVRRPDAGTVTHRPQLTVGYVPQKLSIDPTLPLTVDRLMTLTGRLPKDRIDRALGEVGITHLRRSEARSLSGGEFQRALLARAIARDPDLLVLDEPVQGVDFAGETALYELIQSVRDRTGCGILLISHDLHVVMAATDRVLCLNGHICCQGTPNAVARSPEYLQLFGGRAAEGLAVYQHQHDHTHLPDGRIRHADGRITEGHHPPHDAPEAPVSAAAGHRSLEDREERRHAG